MTTLPVMIRLAIQRGWISPSPEGYKVYMEWDFVAWRCQHNFVRWCGYCHGMNDELPEGQTEKTVALPGPLSIPSRWGSSVMDGEAEVQLPEGAQSWSDVLWLDAAF